MADHALVAGFVRGIERATAFCLAEKGYDITLLCRANKNAAKEVKALAGSRRD